MGHHDYCVPLLQLQGQLLNTGGGDGVQGRGGLVHQQDLGPHSQRPGNAQPLLLTAGEPQGALFQSVLHLVPDGCIPQGLLHDLIQLFFRGGPVGTGTVGNVIIDAHGEGIRLLEHHADVPPQGAHVHVLIENAAAVIAHLPGNPHRGDQVVHAVQGFQKGGLSAAGGPDEGRDVLFGDGHVDPLQGMGISVPELQIFRRNNITHTLLLLAKYLPTSEAEKLIISVKNIKIAAMAKAAPNSPSSLAYT